MGNNTGNKGVGSLWQSPVPYLLGGVLLLLLLLAVALIILAFSYWNKPCGRQARNGTDRSVRESIGYGEKNDAMIMTCSDDMMQGKVTVIMAGDEMPTFLATPMMLANTAGGGISVIIV